MAQPDPSAPPVAGTDASALRAGAVTVVETLRAAGHAALWAGGCVRDALLGVPPHDYDIATDAGPDQVAALFERSVAVGAQFGIVRVIVGGREYEVARFRGEGDAFGPAGDAARRDFTLNALLYDPVADRLYDYVGGRDDLAAGILRACGDPDARFDDDPLRVLRAARFAARFDLAIEPATRAAMTRHAPEVLRASAERISDELGRVLTEGRAAAAFEVLADLGLDALLLPEVPDRARLLARLRGLGIAPAEVGWGAALYDVGPPEDELVAVGERLRWSNRLARGVARAVALARQLGAYPALPVAARKRWVRADQAPSALAIGAIASAAGQAGDAGLQAARADRERWERLDLWPPALLTGRDLVAAGLPPGPGFGRALTAVEDGQLDGSIQDRAAALEAARALLTEPDQRS